LPSQLYIPPFPGDGGLGLGLAFGQFKKLNSDKVIAINHDQQLTAYGLASLNSIDHGSIQRLFPSYSIQDCRGDMSAILNQMLKGEVIAWYCGRSESGPRALGHRSLLALPHHKGLKNFLNNKVKFREDFRPYGCSVLHSYAHEYFSCNKGFHNPFMSFAVPVVCDWKEYLQEVTHVDGTSRMQTVTESQNSSLSRLLHECLKNSLPPIVLNTSLNVMGEPIVETLEDLKRFLDESIVSFAYIDGFLIGKRR
jgi:carbamoyltransferase